MTYSPPDHELKRTENLKKRNDSKTFFNDKKSNGKLGDIIKRRKTIIKSFYPSPPKARRSIPNFGDRFSKIADDKKQQDAGDKIDRKSSFPTKRNLFDRRRLFPKLPISPKEKNISKVPPEKKKMNPIKNSPPIRLINPKKPPALKRRLPSKTVKSPTPFKVSTPQKLSPPPKMVKLKKTPVPKNFNIKLPAKAPVKFSKPKTDLKLSKPSTPQKAVPLFKKSSASALPSLNKTPPKVIKKSKSSSHMAIEFKRTPTFKKSGNSRSQPTTTIPSNSAVNQSPSSTNIKLPSSITSKSLSPKATRRPSSTTSRLPNAINSSRSIQIQKSISK